MANAQKTITHPATRAVAAKFNENGAALVHAEIALGETFARIAGHTVDERERLKDQSNAHRAYHDAVKFAAAITLSDADDAGIKSGLARPKRALERLSGGDGSPGSSPHGPG
jgi:hypothetical protein